MSDALFRDDLFGCFFSDGNFCSQHCAEHDVNSDIEWEKEKPRDLFNVTFGDGKSVFHICPRANRPIMVQNNDLF